MPSASPNLPFDCVAEPNDPSTWNICACAAAGTASTAKASARARSGLCRAKGPMRAAEFKQRRPPSVAVLQVERRHGARAAVERRHEPVRDARGGDGNAGLAAGVDPHLHQGLPELLGG